jgi:DNA-directed RNA polymerase beta subunit
MIQFKNWRQYTHVVDGVRFPQDIKEPFLLIYFPENSNFIEDYAKMNLRKIDFKNVSVPLTTVPRTRMTPDLVRAYRALKLIPYAANQKVPPGKNVILDLSQYTNAIDVMYKPTNYRQRAGFLLKNILKTATAQFPDNYQKILLYSIDLNREVNTFVNRKIFPIVRDMKDGSFLFDDMILNTVTNGKSNYRLLVKDGEFTFQRVLHYVRNLKGVLTDAEQETETNKATKIIMKALDKNIDSKNVASIKGAIQTYLQKDPDEVTKIVSGDANADEIKTIATSSILYGTSGDINRATAIAKKIPAARKTKALTAISTTLAGDIIPPTKAESLATNETVLTYDPVKMVDGKAPKHIFKKRQLDFETNLRKDLINSFKVLESKDLPLKFEKFSVVHKPGRAGEILKSDINIATVTLKDQFGNTHNIKLELPRINPSTGVFRLNGKQKCLVNQIVQNPITFPKPGHSRFESSYSVFRIYVKSLRRVKYLEAFMSYKMPLFFLLSFSFGFEKTCNQYKIKYEIVDTKPTGEKYFAKIKEGQYCVFKNVNTELQEQLVVGFIHGKPEQYTIEKEFPSKEYFEDLIITLTGRMNSTFLISSNLQNIVDPVAKQVLKSQQFPTSLDLIINYMADKVVQGYVIERNDLSNQRIRNSEVLVHLTQKQILAAYTVYKEQVLSGNEQAQFEIPSTKVLSDFLMTELVVDMEYANPIEEMSTMTRVSPVGQKVGGIPDKRAIQTTARNIHPSYFGNIDPLDTPESDNIGIAQQLTIDALISSSRGMFSSKNITDTEGSGMLSTTTSMVPFLENVDGARIIMLANQAKQMVPLKDPQAPIVQSGYESILTDVLSDNFVKRSPCNGKIISISKDAIKVQCGSKGSKTVDISPVHLRSGSGKNTLSVFNPVVEKNERVKENQVIAEGACMSNGAIALGRPLLAALMPYKGYNFEDGAVISESVAKEGKLTSLHGIEEEVIVAENDRLLYIANVGDAIEKGKPILRKTFGDVEDIIGFEEDETTDMYSGQFIKKSQGGRIVDIDVFSNVGDTKFPMLTDLIARTNKRNPKLPKDKFTYRGETIKGVYIRFKIEQELDIKVSDKLCNRYGNKGIISIIEKDELMPRMPNGERVEILLNPLGLLGRMNIGQLYEMYCGLMARELGKIIPTLKTKVQVVALIKKVYGHLDKSKNKETTERLGRNISSLSTTAYAKFIAEIKKSGFYPIIIPPFKAPGHRDIENALKSIGLKSAYKLKLPEYNTTTTHAVPCGYMYIAKLEHMGDAKIHGRSTGPMTGKTAQPTAGKKREGGQRLGELDTYSFISYNCPSVLAEFMGPLSDDYITKEEMLAEIIKTGGAEYREPKTSPARDLLNSYFISLMLTRD